MSKNLTLVLGALTGVVGMLAMIRLVAAADLLSTFAWVFTLLAMLPWVAYCAWRARHGRLTATAGLGILALCTLGLIGVWLFTLGPVIALLCSLAAFAVIWVHDWPVRRPRGDDQFVRIEELTAEEALV